MQPAGPNIGERSLLCVSLVIKPVKEVAMRGWQIGALGLACLVCGGGVAMAAEVRAEMHRATPTGPGEAVGTVTISDGSGGAAVKTALKGLPPGSHGFHVHQNGSCDPTTPAGAQPVPAGAAGGQYDPQNAGKHEGPQGSGHLGDLPVLEVGADGAANATLTAPHIKDVASVRGKAVMIHAGGDNYSDQPQPLGGGGARIACGVLQ
jgi:Cu-Zn family superoxide dismutase